MDFLYNTPLIILGFCKVLIPGNALLPIMMELHYNGLLLMDFLSDLKESIIKRLDCSMATLFIPVDQKHRISEYKDDNVS